jgi:hypothetical protein
MDWIGARTLLRQELDHLSRCDRMTGHVGRDLRDAEAGTHLRYRVDAPVGLPMFFLTSRKISARQCCKVIPLRATTAAMMPTPRAPSLAHCALASIVMIGCANDGPGVDAQPPDSPAYALQTPSTDAGSLPVAPASGISFSVAGTDGAKLVVSGAKCTDDRCTLATVPTTPVRVDLTLSSHGTADMPVWVRWRGCTPSDGQLWPVWSGGPTPEYQTLYTHIFDRLAPGSACVAEVTQGTWYIFAGNLSVKATTNAQYCRDQYSSPENLTLHCFVPAKDEIAVTSDLLAWECFTAGARSNVSASTIRQASVKLTAAGNEVVSCTGRAR